MDDIVARGAKPENIRIVAVVVAPPAMVKLSEKYKGGCCQACNLAQALQHEVDLKVLDIYKYKLKSMCC